MTTEEMISNQLNKIEGKLDETLKCTSKLGQWKTDHEKAHLLAIEEQKEFRINVCMDRGKRLKKVEKFHIYIVAGIAVLSGLFTLLVKWQKIESWIN